MALSDKMRAMRHGPHPAGVLAWVLLLLALLHAPAMADTWAVLVGIDDYTDPNITDLDYTVSDVTRFYEALTDPNVGNVPASHVYLMTNRAPGRDARPTAANVLFRVENLAGRVQPGDTFLFYFAGHGMVRGGEQFLLSINADRRALSTLESTAISLKRLQRLLSGIRARQVAVFLDACRNDPQKAYGDEDNLLTDELARAIKPVAPGAAGGSRELTATFYACSLKQRAYEWPEKQSGVFSYYLVEGLRGKAADAGGCVTLQGLAQYVTDAVRNWSQEHGRQQTPWLVSEGASEAVLVSPLDRLRELANERERLEAELARLEQQRQKQQAEATDEAETQQREAQLAEKVRQARLAEEAERRRMEMSERQRLEAVRQQQEQEKLDAARRERLRQEQLEVERKRQELEQERQRLAAAQVMDIKEAIAKAQELRAQIGSVRPKVEQEIQALVDAIPKPQVEAAASKGEFEKQADYEARLAAAKQQAAEAQQRYDREVAAIRGRLEPEIGARTSGYRAALDSLEEREFVLDESQVVLELGRYDAEVEQFPDAIIRGREMGVLRNFSWNLVVPITQAPQLKKSVQDGTARLRVHVLVDSQQGEAQVQRVLVEDLVQERTFSYPLAKLRVVTAPVNVSVRVNGEEPESTPYEASLPIGQYTIEVCVPTDFEVVEPRTVTLDWHGVVELVRFTLKPIPEVRTRDGAEMVLIPAGTFEMGSEDGGSDEQPVHTVELDAFYMDVHEVTNAQYREFLDATGHREPRYWDNSRFNGPQQPVVGISWDDAVAYCEWAGKRLPTEAEWEYAARGGQVGKDYPWGDEEPDKSRACFGQDVRRGKPSVVGEYAANGYGLYDMAGNVWEWCSDWYGPYPSGRVKNPTGPNSSSSSRRVLRGGSWKNYPSSLRVAYRASSSPTYAYSYGGFRCAQD